MQPGIRRNLYSELGIRENATREEIRGAYRERAKEIHPDRAGSEEDRESAEERMSCLNDIVAVLGDDGRRAEYDAELNRQRKAEQAALLRLSGVTRDALRRADGGRRRVPAWLWFGGLIGLVAAGSAYVLISDNRESSDWASRLVKRMERPAEPAEGQTEGAPAAVARAARASGEKGRFEKTNSLSRFAAGEPTNPNLVEPPLVQEARQALARKVPVEQRAAAAPIPPPPALIYPPVPVPVPAVETPRLAAAPAPAKHPEAEAVAAPSAWQGYWKYVEALGGGVGGAFSPVRIDLFLQAKGEKIVGHYKASYRDTHKYSDRVEFTLEALNRGDEHLGGVWSDGRGDRGEFNLNKVDARVVQMSWWTTKLARKDVLVSGSARLMEAGGY